MFVTEWSSSGIVQCDAAEHLGPLDQRTGDGPWGRVPTGLQRGESPSAPEYDLCDAKSLLP